MSKILTIPNSLDEINKTSNLADGFIIGIKDMSVNVNFYIDINSLDTLNSIPKDIFISLNKNMNNSDLKKVEEILIKLNDYNIKGVLFYDLGVLNIYKRLNLKYDLVFAQEHATTNYNTINFYNDLGVRYSYLSSNITLDEIKTIKANTKSLLMVNLFGYLPMFVSKRHIVKNYLEYFNLKDNSKVNYIEKEGKTYPIIDNSVGTQTFSNDILNGIKASIELDLEYIILNSFNIEESKFISVLKMFKSVDKSNVDEYYNNINNMFDNVSDGFLNTKTIYRVKKND